MNSTTLPELSSIGHKLDLSPECFGELRSSAEYAEDGEMLRQRMMEDGYLYLPGYLDRDLVLESRAVVVEKLAKEGFLDPDFHPMEGVVTKDPQKHLRPFQPALSKQNEPLMKLLYSGRMMEFYKTFLNGEVRHYDYTWMRSVPPGSGTKPHCDIVYMGRGTKDLYTAWTPLGDISLEIGGLMILEGSHAKQDKLRNYLSKDVDTYCTNYPDAKEIEMGKKQWHWAGWLTNNPKSLQEKLGGRWLTATEFRAGDLLTFGMGLIHASLDNHSDRIRLSSDSRYQLASEPVDDRWVGEKPYGHGVAGKRGRIC